MMSINRETVVERRQPQLRWSAVFAGAVMSLGIWVALQSLGGGIELTARGPYDLVGDRGAATGTLVWLGIALVVASFLGGAVAGRLAGTVSRGLAALHGGIQWGLVAALGTYALSTFGYAPHRPGWDLLATGIALVFGLGAALLGGTLGIRVGFGGPRDTRRDTMHEIPPPPATTVVGPVGVP